MKCLHLHRLAVKRNYLEINMYMRWEYTSDVIINLQHFLCVNYVLYYSLNKVLVYFNIDFGLPLHIAGTISLEFCK